MELIYSFEAVLSDEFSIVICKSQLQYTSQRLKIDWLYMRHLIALSTVIQRPFKVQTSSCKGGTDNFNFS